MKLTVINSNSFGNGYVIQNDEEALILECGVRFTEVQKALNFQISKVVAALVSHEHGDHFKYVDEYERKSIPVYASAGTWEAKGKLRPRRILKHQEILRVGNFTILPFGVKHDCSEPLGFLINHPESGRILFATDTYYLPYKFLNVRHWLIECNYRKDILDQRGSEGFTGILRDRTLESHMSFDTCVNALKANDLSETKNIVLIHLSERNSNAKEFKEGIIKQFGKATHVASPGLTIDLNKIPF